MGPHGVAARSSLARYAEMLREWAPKVNLVAASDLNRLEERHLGDSLKALPLVRKLPPGPCIDVGSGAGLPGIPLAICVPVRHWVLLEPRRNRAAFLEAVIRELDLNAEVVIARVEQLTGQPGHEKAYALAVARALASPRAALDMIVPLVAEGGAAAVFLGAGDRQGLGARDGIEGLAIVHPGGGEG